MNTQQILTPATPLTQDTTTDDDAATAINVLDSGGGDGGGVGGNNGCGDGEGGESNNNNNHHSRHNDNVCGCDDIVSNSKWIVEDIPRDGNCLFHALVYQLQRND